jgi:hypothetical protein
VFACFADSYEVLAVYKANAGYLGPPFRIRYITIRVRIIRSSVVVAKDIPKYLMDKLSKKDRLNFDHVTKRRLLTTVNGKDLAVSSHRLKVTVPATTPKHVSK